jgi:hypothetical protein
MDLLIVDEVGFVPFTPEGARLLFQTFSERYLKGSLLITSNLEFSRWLEVFGDEGLTGALLDRLTHHCHILEFNGTSFSPSFFATLVSCFSMVFSTFSRHFLTSPVMLLKLMFAITGVESIICADSP